MFEVYLDENQLTSYRSYRQELLNLFTEFNSYINSYYFFQDLSGIQIHVGGCKVTY